MVVGAQVERQQTGLQIGGVRGIRGLELLVVPTATADAGSPASSMPTVAQDATSGIRRDDIALCFIFGSFSYRTASSFAGSC